MLYENVGPYEYGFCEWFETLIFAWLPRKLKKIKLWLNYDKFDILQMLKEWSIWNWFLPLFFFFCWIEDEAFKGTGFFGNNYKEAWPWFGKGEVLIFVCGWILVI